MVETIYDPTKMLLELISIHESMAHTDSRYHQGQVQALRLALTLVESFINPTQRDNDAKISFSRRIFIHKKTGNRYVFLGEGKVATNNAEGNLTCAMYFHPETGNLYSREINEFMEKFEEVK